MGGSILVGLFLCMLAYSTEIVALFSFSEELVQFCGNTFVYDC